MLNKRDLNNIKKALPENGYQLIADRVNSTKEAVRKVLSDPKRYRAEVIKVALDVIEASRLEAEELKRRAKEITT